MLRVIVSVGTLSALVLGEASDPSTQAQHGSDVGRTADAHGDSAEPSAHATQVASAHGQHFMSQYTGDYAGSYQKYMSSGGHKGSSGNLPHYAEGFVKKNAASFEHYMSDPGPGKRDSHKGSSQGGSYQKYMQQYAGDYQKYMGQGSQGSKNASLGGGYQQYMHQYAGDYQKYMGKASPTELSASQSGESSKGASQGGDYQKYMGGQGSKGASQGGDYQQYMHQYAADYQKYMGQGGHGSKDVSQGGGYQKYMQQYAGDYQKYMSQGGAGPKNLVGDGSTMTPLSLNQSRADYKKQYADKYYAQYMPHVKNSSNTTEVGDAFKKRYAGEYIKKYQHFSSNKVAPHEAADCNTTEALTEWRDAQLALIRSYVPEGAQTFAQKKVQETFAKRKATLEQELASGTAPAKRVASGSPATTATAATTNNDNDKSNDATNKKKDAQATNTEDVLAKAEEAVRKAKEAADKAGTPAMVVTQQPQDKAQQKPVPSESFAQEPPQTARARPAVVIAVAATLGSLVFMLTHFRGRYPLQAMRSGDSPDEEYIYMAP